jgi:hypothetical protein
MSGFVICHSGRLVPSRGFKARDVEVIVIPFVVTLAFGAPSKGHRWVGKPANLHPNSEPLSIKLNGIGERGRVCKLFHFWVDPLCTNEAKIGHLCFTNEAKIGDICFTNEAKVCEIYEY